MVDEWRVEMKGWLAHNVKGNIGDQERERKYRKPTGQKTYRTGIGALRANGINKQTRKWDRIKTQWEGTPMAPTIREGT